MSKHVPGSANSSPSLLAAPGPTALRLVWLLRAAPGDILPGQPPFSGPALSRCPLIMSAVTSPADMESRKGKGSGLRKFWV